MTTSPAPKISFRRAAVLALIAGSLSIAAASPSQAATAKAGTVCKKVNAKSGTGSKAVVCKKSSKGLRWTLVKAPAKAADTTLPPKKAADTTLPPKKAADTVAPTTAKKAADTTLPPKK